MVRDNSVIISVQPAAKSDFSAVVPVGRHTATLDSLAAPRYNPSRLKMMISKPFHGVASLCGSAAGNR
jgi:hypothetical protein